jgi:hypothetical protein
VKNDALKSVQSSSQFLIQYIDWDAKNGVGEQLCNTVIEKMSQSNQNDVKEEEIIETKNKGYNSL